MFSTYVGSARIPRWKLKRLENRLLSGRCYLVSARSTPVAEMLDPEYLLG